MTTPRVEVSGLEETKRNMAKLAKKYSAELAKAAVEAAHLVRTEAVKSIQNQSTGRTVERSRVGGGTYEHVAAAEGSAPNTDTGTLVNSVQVEVKPNGVFIGSRLDYAGYLENGTKTMGARPWLFPALEKNRDNIKKLIGKHVNKVTMTDGNV